MLFELFRVFQHIAKTSTFFNSFAVIDRQEDWNTDNLNKSYEQKQLGTWWTRRGVSRQENSKMYPCLAINVGESPLGKGDWRKGRVKHDIYLAVVDQHIEHDGQLAWEQIDRNNLIMLLSAVNRAMEYVLQSDGTFQHPDFRGIGNCKMTKFLSVPEQSIFSSELGIDRLRSKTMKLQFEECIDLTANFANAFEYSEDGVIADIPTGKSQEISNEFAPVKIFDGEGNVIAEIGSGGTFICAGISSITITVNGELWEVVGADTDIAVVNSESDPLGSKIGNEWVIPDTEIQLFVDGDLQFSDSVPTGGNEVINIDLV